MEQCDNCGQWEHERSMYWSATGHFVCRFCDYEEEEQSANDDSYGTSEAYLDSRRARRSTNAQTMAHIKVIPVETREHPVGVAILAVLGLVVGCLVGSVL